MYVAYGSFVESVTMQKLDSSKVPTDLIGYIPYAASWGISDDLEREQRVAQAPASAKSDLSAVLCLIDDRLDEWLAGNEATSPTPSKEYIAFSAMRMAADFI